MYCHGQRELCGALADKAWICAARHTGTMPHSARRRSACRKSSACRSLARYLVGGLQPADIASWLGWGRVATACGVVDGALVAKHSTNPPRTAEISGNRRSRPSDDMIRYCMVQKVPIAPRFSSCLLWDIVGSIHSFPVYRRTSGMLSLQTSAGLHRHKRQKMRHTPTGLSQGDTIASRDTEAQRHGLFFSPKPRQPQPSHNMQVYLHTKRWQCYTRSRRALHHAVVRSDSPQRRIPSPALSCATL
jgi:hypothetical protein